MNKIKHSSRLPTGKHRINLRFYVYWSFHSTKSDFPFTPSTDGETLMPDQGVSEDTLSLNRG